MNSRTRARTASTSGGSVKSIAMAASVVSRPPLVKPTPGSTGRLARRPRRLRFPGARCRCSPCRLVIEELAEPTPADGDVLVGLRACGSCGSDVHTLAQPGALGGG